MRPRQVSAPLDIEMSNDGVDEAKAYLDAFFKTNEGSYLSVQKKKLTRLFCMLCCWRRDRSLPRCTAKMGAMMTIDVALRNDRWFEVR